MSKQCLEISLYSCIDWGLPHLYIRLGLNIYAYKGQNLCILSVSFLFLTIDAGYITGSAESMNAFTLNQNTGQVFTKVMLDREDKAEYMLCIEASKPDQQNTERDLAALNRTNKILFVKVTVNDVNDLGPKFYEPRVKTGDISTYLHRTDKHHISHIFTLMLRGFILQFCCFSKLLDFLPHYPLQE